jgi:hypothetical protein
MGAGAPALRSDVAMGSGYGRSVVVQAGGNIENLAGGQNVDIQVLY